MFQPLDGPAVEEEITVDAITPKELIVSTASPSDNNERKVITFEAQNGRVRWGFTNGITASKGFIGFKNQIITVEASASQPVYIIAETGTVKVYFVERS